MRPLLGGYYWFPTSTMDGLSWDVLTCHDLAFDAEVGHVDMWPTVVDRLAAAWGRAACGFRRQLIGRYTGLPRGRITRPGRTVLILHGDDAPAADWREKLIEGYGLGARSHRFLFDEHERMLPGDPEQVEESLRHPLNPASLIAATPGWCGQRSLRSSWCRVPWRESSARTGIRRPFELGRRPSDLVTG
jgi:hypothetical protein